jgi:hypothetical protein
LQLNFREGFNKPEAKTKLTKIIKIYCGVEQLVARRAHNPKVVGSSPSPATSKKPLTQIKGFSDKWGISSVG